MTPAPAAAPRVLVADDDDGNRRLLAGCLAHHGYDVEQATDGAHALELLRARPADVVVSDIRMPRLTGLELLRALREAGSRVPVLLVTAYPDVRDAVGAMRDGAVNYLEKPIDLDELLAGVRAALRDSVPGGAGPVAPAAPAGIVAESPAMRAVLRDVAIAGPAGVCVLLTGESGTGKEVVADALHAASPRAGRPFIKVNCAAIPETLLESELFGHEKGAFTGAVARRAGVFEEARGGSLLLDEIAEMPAALQAKLLRVLQDGGFRRVGGSQTLQADVRLVASTNRDLEEEMRAGRFREDLYYRLNVFEIHLAPLRERPEDIVPLATHFASRFLGSRVRFSPAAVALLCTAPWPGNARELRNAMERAVLLARSEVILPEHLPPRLRASAAAAAGEGDSVPGSGAPGMMADVERSVILQTLRNHGFNRSETARALGISRRALIYKLQRFRDQGHVVDGDGGGGGTEG